jgi:hypothetical protein
VHGKIIVDHVKRELGYGNMQWFYSVWNQKTSPRTLATEELTVAS